MFPDVKKLVKGKALEVAHVFENKLDVLEKQEDSKSKKKAYSLVKGGVQFVEARLVKTTQDQPGAAATFDTHQQVRHSFLFTSNNACHF
jgi:hypothetical protein